MVSINQEDVDRAAAWLIECRYTQGLPATVDNPVAIAGLGRILGEVGRAETDGRRLALANGDERTRVPTSRDRSATRGGEVGEAQSGGRV